MTDFFDVVLSQRAARSFGPDDVDDATVAKILTAATHAPSAENSQPFVFIVVRDPALRPPSAASRLASGREGPGRSRPGASHPPSSTRWTGAPGGGVAAAPVLVVVCGDARLTFAPTLGASVFPAVQNLLLAAHALGLGSTLTTLPVLGGGELSALLGLPDEVEPLAVVPLGHLVAPLGPPRRRPLAEKAHLDRYGVPFLPGAVTPVPPGHRPRPADPPQRRRATNSSRKVPYRSTITGHR